MRIAKSQVSPEKELRSLYLTVGIYVIIFFVKLVAYFTTHVMAL